MPRPVGGYVDVVRRGMSGPGFALVDTPPFFDDGRLLGPKRSTTLVSACPDPWRKFPQLDRYGRWLERLLAGALPGEAVALAALEFRYEPEGYADAEVDRLHADGSYIRSVCTLYGPATVYRDRALERPVPDGQTLLMTAQDRTRALRVRCTLHRRPGPGPERAVVVCSFETRDLSFREATSRPHPVPSP